MVASNHSVVDSSRPWVRRVVLLAIIGVVIAGAFVWLTERVHVASGRLDPALPRDLARLEARASSAAPLIAALDAWTDEHGAPPADLAPIEPRLVPDDFGADRWEGWFYMPDDAGGYLLWSKLGFDPVLWYHAPRGVDALWRFEPGDGSAGVMVEFGER